MQVEKDKKWIDSIYMLHENEMWLNEQAQKGLLLKSFDKRHAFFIKDRPENINYKIVILNKEKAENQIKIIEHQGFNFVGSYEEYYIFYINERYGHIQPRLNEETIEFTLKWFNKQIKKIYIELIVGIAIIIVLNSIFFIEGLLITYCVNSQLRLYMLPTIVCFITFIFWIRESFVLFKSKKCFLEHVDYNAHRSLIKSKILKIMLAIWLWVSILLPVCNAYLDYNNHVERTLIPIGEIDQSMPIVLLQNIDTQEELSGELSDIQNDIVGDNYVEVKHTFMAPKQYSAWQENLDNRMNILYYEVINDVLAKPLTKEILIDSIYNVDKEQIKKVDFTGLDDVYTYQEPEVIYVSACKNKKVMLIIYHGEQPVEKILNEIAKVL